MKPKANSPGAIVKGKTDRLLRYSFLSLLHLFSTRRLPRTPEPSAVTNDIDDVNDYDRVMSTVMALPYALALNCIWRARGNQGGNRGGNQGGHRALDLCCGPGFFTLLLNRRLGYREVLGVDLSRNMLDAARRNAVAADRQEQVRFREGSVFDLSGLQKQSFDLVAFCNGAHQFDAIDDVVRVLAQAAQVVKPDGLVFVLDPVRQKTQRLTEGYVRVAGEDYLRQGLTAFHRQFRESLYASWSPQELAGAVPQSSGRRWVQILPSGLPTFQMLLGLPSSQRRTYLRPAMSPADLREVIPPHAAFDWKLLSAAFAAGSSTKLNAQ